MMVVEIDTSGHFVCHMILSNWLDLRKYVYPNTLRQVLSVDIHVIVLTYFGQP